MKARQLATNIGLTLLTLLLLFIVAEVGLRLLLSRNLNPFEPDPELEFRLRSSFDGVYPRTWVRTDSLGRRIPAEQTVDATGRKLFAMSRQAWNSLDDLQRERLEGNGDPSSLRTVECGMRSQKNPLSRAHVREGLE